MIKKIISGGQTGADRAALDIALKLNIDHGGWIPKGRKTEAGPLEEKYLLKEMPTADYKERTQKNIIDSQGTVIISRAELSGGSKLTQSYAQVIGRPNCFLNLSYTQEYEASEILRQFIMENKIQILNVAGPRLSSQPWIYQDVRTVLEVTLYQLFLHSDQEKIIQSLLPRETIVQEFPKTLADAVSLLCDDLPLKTRAFIAKQNLNQIYLVYFAFQDFIKQRLGLNSDNHALVEDCFSNADSITATPIEDAVMIIVKRMKKQLEPNHVLRVIK